MARKVLKCESTIRRMETEYVTLHDMCQQLRAELEREKFNNGYWEREYESCRKEREDLAAKLRGRRK